MEHAFAGTASSREVYGRLILVTDNAISKAIVAIAAAVDIPTLVLDSNTPGEDPRRWFEATPPGSRDAVVFCDHDAPSVGQLLRSAIDSDARYVAMMASRRRAAGVLEDLGSEGFPIEKLRRVHLPAGLRIGGKSPGEIALSVIAEVVADANGADGSSMRLR
jgi:xanthine/CO dehydrogenase XdhC/CoxF family maturation factor